jgi:hypothetical protein
VEILEKYLKKKQCKKKDLIKRDYMTRLNGEVKKDGAKNSFLSPMIKTTQKTKETND